MRSSRRRALGLVVFSSVGLSNAVILGDFLPRVTDLSQTCNEVYLRQIPGCSAANFSSRRCPQACINGLQQIQGDVQEQCRGARNIPGNSVLASFLGGRGLQAVCDNIAVVTENPGGQPPPPAPSDDENPRPPPPPPDDDEEDPEPERPTFAPSRTVRPPPPATNTAQPPVGGPEDSQPTGGADPSAPTETGVAPEEPDDVSGGGSVFDSLTQGSTSSATAAQVDSAVRAILMLVTPSVLLASTLL